jgi:transposase
MKVSSTVPAKLPLQGRIPVADSPGPDPEVVERPTRRSFTVAYELEIMAAPAAGSDGQQVGALLRREGLYSSHLANWRKQYASGGRAALAQPRGRKLSDPAAPALTHHQQENTRTSATTIPTRRVSSKR